MAFVYNALLILSITIIVIIYCTTEAFHTVTPLDIIMNAHNNIFLVSGIAGSLLAVALWSSKYKSAFVIIPLAIIIGECALTYGAQMTPLLIDPSLHRIDAGFGHPSFIAGRFFNARPAIKSVIHSFYILAPLFAACFMYLQIKLHDKPDMLLKLLVLSILGYLTYLLLPACGPTYITGTFPDVAPQWQDIPDHIATFSFRNCMPSLHFAWAIMLWWNARKYTGPIHILYLVFLIANGAATLALGEHYFIDLCLSLPYVLLVQFIFGKYKIWAMFQGLIIIVFILLILYSPSYINWIFIAAAFFWCIVFAIPEINWLKHSKILGLKYWVPLLRLAIRMLDREIRMRIWAVRRNYSRMINGHVGEDEGIT